MHTHISKMVIIVAKKTYYPHRIVEILFPYLKKKNSTNNDYLGQIENYHHSNPVYIRASLATNEIQPKLHVHKLMGRHCSVDGFCTLPVNLDTMTAM